MTWDEIQRIEIGSEAFPGQRVVSLKALFGRLQEDAAKNIVLDYKEVGLPQLTAMMEETGVTGQVTLATCSVETAQQARALLPRLRIKQWVGGSAEAIRATFREASAAQFHGFEEIQLHLNELPQRRPDGWRYQLLPEDITRALGETRQAGVLLQVLPWHFEDADLQRLLELGVRSFAVDYPARFMRACDRFFRRRG